MDEMDLTADAIYIVTPINGEFRAHIDHRRSILQSPQRAKIVWWNLERPDADGSPPIQEIVTDILKYADAVWVSDKQYQSMDLRMDHVVLGSHVGLRISSDPAPAAYDYTHQSYAWGRRDAIYIPLRSLGLREGPNGWYEERDKTLRSSRLMLNVHQTPALIGEPIRFALTAAYKMPMISETLADPYPLASGVDYLEAPFDGLVGVVSRFISVIHPSTSKLGNNLHQRLCVEWTFRRGVEEGVARTLARIGAKS